jgi:molybdopterin molybdotransferase
MKDQEGYVQPEAEITLHLDDAVKIILDNVCRLSAMAKPLSLCAGLAAAESVYADMDLPRSDIAGRDGYAVRSQDIRLAEPENPVLLRIIAAARAGRPASRAVKPGDAIRIMTGSLMPRGADCVVQFEDTDEPGNKKGPGRESHLEVKIFAAMPPGANIWPAGNNIRKNARLLKKGDLIGPAQISALASIGKTRISVIRRPQVAIISTGDELVRHGGRLTGGKIYSGNAAAVAALVSHYGGVPKRLGIARDREDALTSKIRKGMTSDAIITIGGVSKGDFDLVRPVVAKMGRVLFSGICMIPGKATAFGIVKTITASDVQKTVPVFCLSGPPTACLINFETLVRPALLRMAGLADVHHFAVEAVALEAVRNTGAMAVAMLASLQVINGAYHVRFNISQGRSMQAALAVANSFAILPEGTGIKTGDKIRVRLLDWNRNQFFMEK